MTRDEFKELLDAHGIVFAGDAAYRVAQLVAAAEREACAKVCDARALKNEQACDGADADETISLRSAAWQISVCAAAIRARSNA